MSATRSVRFLPALLLAWLLLAACSSTRPPARTVDLDADSRPAGTVFESRARTTMPRLETTLTDAAGDTLRHAVAQTHEYERKHLEVLAVEDGRTTRQRETYFEDVAIRAAPSLGRSDTLRGPLTGETVIATLGEDAGGAEEWTYTLEEGEPSLRQVEALEEAAPGGLDVHRLRTGGTRTVGEAWTVEGAELAEMFGEDPEHFSGRVTVRLDGVSTCPPPISSNFPSSTLPDDWPADPTPCALLGIEMHARSTSTDEDGRRVTVVLDLEGAQHRALDGPYNLMVDLQGRMQMHNENGPRRLAMHGPVRILTLLEVVRPADAR